MKPHKHAALIKAWADGAEIQCRQIDDGSWFYLKNPTWSEYNEYRIKPNKRKYRVAEIGGRHGAPSFTATADTESEGEFISTDQGFIRWLTDWIEYDATHQETK
jgi:hypothetical protein